MIREPVGPVHFTCVRCGHGITKLGHYCAGDRNPHCGTPTCPWCRECVAAKNQGQPVEPQPHHHVWDEVSTVQDRSANRRVYRCITCGTRGEGRWE